MISAFGVDHGEISKRERDRKKGAAIGALTGAAAAPSVAGAGLGADLAWSLRSKGASLKDKAILRTALPAIGAVGGPPTVVNMARSKSTRGAALKVLGSGAAVGAGAGAAIGRKKKKKVTS